MGLRWGTVCMFERRKDILANSCLGMFWEALSEGIVRASVRERKRFLNLCESVCVCVCV